jgi:hypothetical protein
MPGPHDFAVRIVLFVRMKYPCCNPTRPPHPALNVRDDRDTPLSARRDREWIYIISEKTKEKFCGREAA